ncbi:hypothetical protein RP20_CCG023716 [Aedes albopictus]|nr:hypothetical protein RP20_CCG023716 [Aedes albopictus]
MAPQRKRKASTECCKIVKRNRSTDSLQDSSTTFAQDQQLPVDPEPELTQESDSVQFVRSVQYPIVVDTISLSSNETVDEDRDKTTQHQAEDNASSIPSLDESFVEGSSMTTIDEEAVDSDENEEQELEEPVAFVTYSVTFSTWREQPHLERITPADRRRSSSSPSKNEFSDNENSC